MESSTIIYIIKLIASGLVSFLAILLMSKLRTIAWAMITSGFLFSYAILIYELLTDLGVIAIKDIMIFTLPLSKLICATVPSLFFISAFIIMLAKRKR